MTEDEFQRRYHDFAETDAKLAKDAATYVNAQAYGFTVSAVNFGHRGYALMLDTAIAFSIEMGIIKPSEVLSEDA